MPNAHVRKKFPPVRLAVIGGSGLYDFPGLKETRRMKVKTPFGSPSDDILIGRLGDTWCAFLPRHGRGHVWLPSEVPSRANVYALKSLGVERVVGIGACGSLKEEIKPRHFLIPDQVVDRTRCRPATFFGGGIVAHVTFDRPFCEDLRQSLVEASREVGVTTHPSGTALCMEGPAFSTKAESEDHRSRGWDVVGMTLLPEAKLAREAELCYANVALVTDYDVWKEGEEVSSNKVLETLSANVDHVRQMLTRVLPRLGGPRACSCGVALRQAVFTHPDAMAPAAKRRLALLLDKKAPR